MGCVVSKKAVVSVTPAADSSGVLRAAGVVSVPAKKGEAEPEGPGRAESDTASTTLSFRLGNLHRYIKGELVAAGWPAWLSAVAGEAIQGWVPLKADSFEKLEKIGQGTYSSVFRARDLDTGKIVALKKVRFDNFDPESVRFMAREIQILRRLDHPNIVKLEGLITSQFSCSIYLVFEYMEHDLAGLLSLPDIQFTESQVKCYMHQLLSGLEHCHLHGIIHRDIKGANLLVNNEGILKMADFGLANFCNPGQKHPLTSRVVTLWYRPPELLLGSTDYEATVDLWSVGCVFAEMFIGKPILQGRTEVEQLHKIFKLCGSPSEEYWKKSKLPHSTIFKPHHPYESCLRETFSSLPLSVCCLLETFLSVEPDKRGTTSTALASEYFKTKPHACEPSSLPKYPPNKEIDAKSREESRRRKASGRGRMSEATRRPSRTYRTSHVPSRLSKLAARPEDSQNAHGMDNNGVKLELPRVNGDTRLFVDLQPMPKINHPDEGRHVKHISQGDIPFSGPLHVPASSGFAWVKKQREDYAFGRSNSKSSSRSHDSGVIDPNLLQVNSSFDLKNQSSGDGVHEKYATSKDHESHDLAKHLMMKRRSQLEHPDSFDASDFHSQDLSETLYTKDSVTSKQCFLGYQDEGERVEFSGPLISQVHRVDELLQQRERHIRQAVRRSWFQRGKKQGK